MSEWYCPVGAHETSAEQRKGRKGCKPCEAERDREKRLERSGMKKRYMDAPSEDSLVLSKEVMREIRIEGGNGLILGDIHLPVTDYDVLNEAIAEAVRLGATEWCVLAGDTLNFDALSDYLPKQDDAGLLPEIESANQLLKALLKVFDRVVMTTGNHDIRVQKALGWKLKFEHSMRMLLFDVPSWLLAKLEVTGRDYCLIDSDQGVWRACHTADYSRAPLAVPAKLADLYRQNVIGFHRHHHAIGHSPSGYMVVEGGGCFDRSRTEYLVRWSKTFPVWQPGYTVLMGGLPWCPRLHGRAA